MEMIRLQIQILIFLGIVYFFGRKGWISQAGASQLNRLIMQVILPASIFRSFQSGASQDVIASSVQILLLSIVIQAVMVLTAHLLCTKIQNRSRAVSLEYAIMSNNSGTLGMIVAQAAFGEPGVLYASIYVLPVRILMWSWGVALYRKGQSDGWKELLIKVITHPCMIAILLGMLMMYGTQQGFVLPLWLDRSIASLAGCNTVLIMIVIGVVLSGIPWKSLADPGILGYCLLRLILIPAVFWALFSMMGLFGTAVQVCVLELAMPAPITMSLLAQRYGSDEAYASRLIFLSTILSMITLPVWSLLLQ